MGLIALVLKEVCNCVYGSHMIACDVVSGGV